MGEWKYRSYPDENGVRFAARQHWNDWDPGSGINFWHITPEHTYFFTFKPDERFNRHAEWNEAFCERLLTELRLPKPSLQLVRYAVDEKAVFYNSNLWRIPKTPPAPQTAQQQKQNNRKTRAFRAAIEEEKGNAPAPYILYGKHEGLGKEYAWRLTPDKPKRQGIQPGDLVLVWTSYGFRSVIVTRVEPSDGQPQPKYRVKKKLAPVIGSMPEANK